MRKATNNLAYLFFGILLFCAGSGCDSQAPGDVQEQFDADTVNAPEPADSGLKEQTTPMVTDSTQRDSTSSGNK